MSNLRGNRGKGKHSKLSEDEEVEQQGEYNVEKICGVRTNPKTKRKEYYVKWEGYPETDNTWEPVSNLRKVLDLVEEFDFLQKEKENGNYSKSVVANKKSSQNELKSQQEIKSNPSSKNKQRMSSGYEQNSSVENEEHDFNDDVRSQQKLKIITELKKTSSTNSLHKTGKTSSQVMEVNEQKLSKFDEGLCEQEEAGESNQSEPQFIFEKILDRRDINGFFEYLVKFENISSNNWVPETELEGFEAEIKEFNKQFELQLELQQQQLLEQQLQQKKTSTRDREEVVLQNSKTKSKSQSNLDQAKEKVSHHQKVHQLSQQEAAPNVQLSSKSKEKNMKQQLDLYETETDSQFEQTNKNDTNSLFEDSLPIDNATNKNFDKKTQSRANKKEFKFEKEEPRQNQKDDISQSQNKGMKLQQLLNQNQASEIRQKRVIEDVHVDVVGDFKTDNYEKLVLQGDFNDIMQSRIEVHWRKRLDGTQPASQVYSSTYLRKHEPSVFIDLLVNKIANKSS